MRELAGHFALIIQIDAGRRSIESNTTLTQNARVFSVPDAEFTVLGSMIASGFVLTFSEIYDRSSG